VKRLADHRTEVRRLAPEIVYTDLDGTLFGPGGSLFAGRDGEITVAAAEALAMLHRAGLAVVPVSGRTEDQVREAGRVIGATGFIAELGGIIDTGEETIRRYGAFPGPGTPFEGMARSGAAGFLLEEFAGRLEPHAPWAFRGRECTMLLRGHVDVVRAEEVLAAAGYGWLDLVDNGRITSVAGPTPVVHAYHLAPRGVTKAEAVAEDLARRSVPAERAVLVGDGPSDVAVTGRVRAVFLVANGLEALSAEDAPPSLFVTDAERGEGFAEVVAAVLG
jgi:predicted mannosyl-3-phosphoglycerate phosphatase (HAD superfamily)